MLYDSEQKGDGFFTRDPTLNSPPVRKILQSIGNEKVDTQRQCFPELSIDVADIDNALFLAHRLKNDQKFYNVKIMKPFISRWINQMFCSYFSVLTMNGLEKKKKDNAVEIYLGYSFFFYIIFQCLKFYSVKNFLILFYWLKIKLKYYLNNLINKRVL